MKRKLLLVFALFFSAAAFAQNTGTISGKVTNPEGKPLIAASVSLKATTYGTTTDSLGFYTLSGIPAGKYKLILSALGFHKIVKELSLSTSRNLELNISVSENANDLDEVTVTGNKPVVTSSSEYVSKLPLKNLENAQVYTGITNALMVQQKIYTLEDAVRNVPGINLASGNGFANTIDYGGAIFSSRGFQTKIKALNGLANNMAGTGDVANLEKIEVIKGPSATLFGNIISSYGGLINRVTKKPYSSLGGSVDYAGGTYGFHRLAVDLNSPLNKDSSFLARVNVALQNRNTFQDHGGYSRSLFVAPAFSYKLSNKITINMNAEINRTTDGGQGNSILFSLTPSFIKGYLPAVLKGFGLPEASIQQIISSAPTTISETFGSNNIKDFNLDPYRSYVSNDLTSQMNSFNMSGEVNYKISEQWKSVTSAIFGSGNSSGYNIYMNLVPNTVPALVASLTKGQVDFGIPGADYLSRNARRHDASLETQQVQQNFIGDFKVGGLRNRLVVGLDFYHYKANSLYKSFVGSLFGLPQDDMFDQVKISGDVPDYYKFNRESIDNKLQTKPSTTAQYGNSQNVYSTYVNDVLNITDRIIASAGLRVDRFENKGNYDGTKNEWQNRYKQTALSPKFGLIYQPVRDKVALFGNYQTGFTNKEGTDFEGKGFRPEEASQWETGVKTSFFDGHFTSTVSYYDIKVKDIVRSDFNNPLFMVQDGTQISRGFEAEILGNPTPELNILLGYAFNQSKMVKAEAIVEGLRPTDAGPKHQFNFWLHYHFNQYTSLNGISVGFGGNYVGETFAANLNPDGAIIIPQYTVLNMKVSYDRPKYSFGIRANNLANEKYWIGNGNIFPQMPRQFVGSLAIKI